MISRIWSALMSPSRKVPLSQTSHIASFFCSPTSHDSSEQERLPGLGFATTGLPRVSCCSQTTCQGHFSAAWWLPCGKERTMPRADPSPLPTAQIEYCAQEGQVPQASPEPRGQERNQDHEHSHPGLAGRGGEEAEGLGLESEARLQCSTRVSSKPHTMHSPLITCIPQPTDLTSKKVERGRTFFYCN